MSSDNRSLQIALIISAIAHGSIIFLPHLKLMPEENRFKKTELTYLKAKTDNSLKLKKTPAKRNINLPQPLPQWQNTDFKSSADRPLPSFFSKDKFFTKFDELFKNKPQLSKPDIIAIKKKIALTPIKLEKITNPSYISYYQIVREKIRRAAYQNYTSQDIGEVYLSFVISADGRLTKAKISEEKSTPSAYLKEIALKSLKNAADFPSFPKDLDYPELSFNVIISFEIE